MLQNKITGLIVVAGVVMGVAYVFGYDVSTLLNDLMGLFGVTPGTN